MSEAWAPTLADVGRHIPTRTRDTSPGSDLLLGTFTETTTPTAEQAQSFIDAAVRALTGLFGAIPEGAQAAARDAAEWRAAADIEVAYPNRQADVNVFGQLSARADAAQGTLARILADAGAGLAAGEPAWAFPAPPAWGDVDL